MTRWHVEAREARVEARKARRSKGGTSKQYDVGAGDSRRSNGSSQWHVEAREERVEARKARRRRGGTGWQVKHRGRIVDAREASQTPGEAPRNNGTSNGGGTGRSEGGTWEEDDDETSRVQRDGRGRNRRRIRKTWRCNSDIMLVCVRVGWSVESINSIRRTDRQKGIYIQVEPARPRARDPKSRVSTNSTIPASSQAMSAFVKIMQVNAGFPFGRREDFSEVGRKGSRGEKRTKIPLASLLGRTIVQP